MNGGTKQIQPERGEGQHVFKSHHAKRCETKPRLLKGKLLLKSKWQVYEHAQERGNHFQRCEYHVWEKFEAMESRIDWKLLFCGYYQRPTFIVLENVS